MKINDVVKEVHNIAKLKGWHDTPRSALEIHALIHSEISEATEEVRNGSPDSYYHLNIAGADIKYNTNDFKDLKNRKPEGESVELVDAVIRIWDYFAEKDWNFEEVLKVKMDYNKTRSYKHGKLL